MRQKCLLCWLMKQDLSKKEQDAIVLKYYVDSKLKGMLHEHFLTFVEAVSLTAESLTKYILDTSIVPRWSQMDHFSRLWWCFSHEWTVLWRTAAHPKCGSKCTICTRLRPHIEFGIGWWHQDCTICNGIFHFAWSFVFVSTTRVHAVFMQKQQELHPDKQPIWLQKLSETRWACRSYLPTCR